MFSRNNSTAISWPKEGALHLTQVMIMKKGIVKKLKKAADFLVSQKAQEIFSKNASFVPVIPNVEIPKYYKENNTALFWKGWDNFIAMGKK
jgi:ABC-type Fe3+ transport system substrate-binding protein